LAALAETLDDAERRRVDRYGRPELARRFIARRGTLKLLLAERLGIRPNEVVLGYRPSGKPFLPGRALTFSVSSRGDDGLIAIAEAREIGVDIERTDTEFPWSELAGTTFSLPERDLLLPMNPPTRSQESWRAWTAKEACAKALGTGLGSSLSALAVLPRSTHRHVRAPDGRELKVVTLPMDGERCGALALLEGA
jgi:4'-phosphopantetheinyl transferase